ncbi:MAG: tRNA (adenosine(37)-N6)-threonylcarbamoyltransferase complex transferase subunit TsaD [Planctomycetes bacterium]|nr:tRNA (adenosine(37)-N6)-threonylcarbamoyltransferase complex transferase subunit TsaD [Planctomycetota bacterium]
MKRFICLGIESSCDETAASVVVDGYRILSNVVVSQEDLHKLYGGVVPEIACRAHIESILPVIDRAITKARLKLKDIDAIAVANTPGLVGALLVGVSAAKSLSLILNKPLIGINHSEAHLYAGYLATNSNINYPAIGLVASGGHTSLYLMSSINKYRRIGSTVDDAAGEAFDKVAAILGLGYPGGPSIQKAAMKGNPKAIRFPLGVPDRKSFNFSFSGLKTAVLYYAKGQNATKSSPLKRGIKVPDVAASFQEAVVETITERVFSAADKFKAKTIIVGGGVVANSRLRDKMQSEAERGNIRLVIPPIWLCTDNAAMIAGVAYHKKKDIKANNLYLDAVPT